MRTPLGQSRDSQESALIGALAMFRIDFAPNQKPPSAIRLLLATVASIAGSLAADAMLVAIGTRIFPATNGYGHFQFSDYAKLTIVGVIIACVAWPVVTLVSSAPRWVFVRSAVLVTAILLLPDAYLLLKGQPAKAVLVLVCMHFAIGLVTYNALVRLAPSGKPLTKGNGAGTVESPRA